MKRLLPEWESYRKQVIAPNAPAFQVRELECAFYGGALSLFKIVNELLGPGPEVTDADVARLVEVNDELMEFGFGAGVGQGKTQA